MSTPRAEHTTRSTEYLKKKKKKKKMKKMKKKKKKQEDEKEVNIVVNMSFLEREMLIGIHTC